MSELSFDQTEDENHRAFVQRLIEAGWSKEDAEQEWQAIQGGRDDD